MNRFIEKNVWSPPTSSICYNKSSQSLFSYVSSAKEREQQFAWNDYIYHDFFVFVLFCFFKVNTDHKGLQQLVYTNQSDFWRFVGSKLCSMVISNLSWIWILAVFYKRHRMFGLILNKMAQKKEKKLWAKATKRRPSKRMLKNLRWPTTQCPRWLNPTRQRADFRRKLQTKGD